MAEFPNQENAAEIISGCGSILDGLDTIESRIDLSSAYEKSGNPYVFGVISG